MNAITEIGAQGFTRRLAAAAAALRWEDVPAPARQVAAQAVLDTIGCTWPAPGNRWRRPCSPNSPRPVARRRRA